MATVSDITATTTTASKGKRKFPSVKEFVESSDDAVKRLLHWTGGWRRWNAKRLDNRHYKKGTREFLTRGWKCIYYASRREEVEGVLQGSKVKSVHHDTPTAHLQMASNITTQVAVLNSFMMASLCKVGKAHQEQLLLEGACGQVICDHEENDVDNDASTSTSSSDDSTLPTLLKTSRGYQSQQLYVRRR